MAQTRFSGPVASDNGFIGAITGNVTGNVTAASGTSTFANVDINGNTAVGNANTDTIGFYGATKVAQPSSTGQTAGFTAGAGTAVLDDSTFTGGTGSTAYTLGDIVKHLKALGLIAS
jgi:hypothetical protein